MTDKNYIHPKRFKWNINNNISPSMLSFWQQNGFLIIDNFYSFDECENLKNRAKLLIKNHQILTKFQIQKRKEKGNLEK